MVQSDVDLVKRVNCGKSLLRLYCVRCLIQAWCYSHPFQLYYLRVDCARARARVCVCIMNIAVIRNDCVVSMKGIFVIFRQVLSPCVVAVLPLCCVLVTLFALLEWISLTIYVRLVSYACWIEMILFEWCIYYALFVLW